MPDVTALATAYLAGHINPTFEPIHTINEAGVVAQLPQYMYMDSGSASQIASLIGGTVVKGDPGNYGPQAPLANLIQVGGGIFNPGPMFPPGVIVNYASLCAAATAFASMIPGGTVGSSCNASGTNTPAFDYQSPPVVMTVNGVCPSGYSFDNGTGACKLGASTIIPAVVNTTNTVPVITSGKVGNTSPSSSVVAQTNVQTNLTNTTASQNNGQVVASTNVFEEDSIGLGLPNWAYAAIGAIGIYFMMGRH